MKRIFCLILPICLLLCGCGERIKEPVTFYYLRSAYQEDMSDVIASEEREAGGHREDLAYLLALYLMGPSEEGLESPLPKGTKIFTVSETDEGILLHISDTTETLTDLQYSLACACLSMTCLELTDAPQVTIASGERSVTMSHDTLTLYDGSTAAPTEDTT